MSSSTVLVVGGSGHVGSKISTILLAAGHSVRGVSSQSRPSDGRQTWAKADLVSGDGVDEAFEGVDRAFLMVPGGYANQFEILSRLIAAAKRHKLKKVVLMTAMGVEANPSGPYRRAEVELKTSGVPYNIIRPNWFMQNFQTFWLHGIKTDGEIQVPAGKAKVGFIDARDVAAVAAALLTSDDKNNRASTLTGPTAIDHDEAARILSTVTGKKIVYKDIDPAVLKQGLLAAGLSEEFSAFFITILGFMKDGYNAAVTGDVEEIIGKPPVTFQRFAEEHTSVWI